jgi:very-short-patch-repair endonuclease
MKYLPALRPKTRSRWEDLLARQLAADFLPMPKREFRFHDVRKWRFDFAWFDRKLAVEVEGAIFAMSRHTRGVGFTQDAEKYNAAVLLGWRVLRFTHVQIKSGEALKTIREAFVCKP